LGEVIEDFSINESVSGLVQPNFIHKSVETCAVSIGEDSLEQSAADNRQRTTGRRQQV